MLLVTSTQQPLVLHWQEQAPPLDLQAQVVDTPDGPALGLRIGLNDAGPLDAGLGAPAWQQLVLLVDGSMSMRRRSAAVEYVLKRVQDDGHVPVLTRTLVDGQTLPGIALAAGHHTTWSEIQAAVEAQHCGPTVRCLVLTDAQLPGLAQAEGSPAEVVVLADPHEATFFAGTIPPRAAVYQPGVEPLARLRSQVDQAVLPVLQLDQLRVGDVTVQPLGRGPWRVAEGGLLRLHAFAAIHPGDALQLDGTTNGVPLHRTLTVTDAGEAGPRLRRASYRDLLAELIRGWKDQPDGDARTRIVDLSLREGIPTAFTSLQVDDPELSLVAIKPGDPILRVPAGPGVTDVVAWYPFGETRRLVRDLETDRDADFSDRFLVPRAWEERAYRVDVFIRHADGTVDQKGTWYNLDEAGPRSQPSPGQRAAAGGYGPGHTGHRRRRNPRSRNGASPRTGHDPATRRAAGLVGPLGRSPRELHGGCARPGRQCDTTALPPRKRLAGGEADDPERRGTATTAPRHPCHSSSVRSVAGGRNPRGGPPGAA